LSAPQTLVDWELARRIAHRVANRQPLPPNYNRGAMERDFEVFTATAEELVTAETGLHSTTGAARGRVTDRVGWVDANINSFKRLLQPLADKIAQAAEEAAAKKSARKPAGKTSKIASDFSSKFSVPAVQKLTALEVGVMLGWMSARVLGQYDLLIVESESDELNSPRPQDQDIVYYVAPNIAALEWRHGFPPDEFRLWIALHEVTHRVQFTGVPWLKDHFLSLVEDSMTITDPKRLAAAVRQVVQARKEGEDPFAEGGLPALLASPQQREVLHKIMGMMSLLEGHGDVTMDRAGAEHLSEIPRFREVMNHRRTQVKGLAKLFRQVIGMEAKLNQYVAGERFISAVESAQGTEFLNLAWQGPEYLPTMDEIRNPQDWASRVQELQSAAIEAETDAESSQTESASESPLAVATPTPVPAPAP